MPCDRGGGCRWASGLLACTESPRVCNGLSCLHARAHTHTTCDTYQVSGYLSNEDARLYEVRRRSDYLEAVLRGDLEPYVSPEVREALSSLPQVFSADSKPRFKDFFDRYGPAFIDQVYTGGMLAAQVFLSAGASLEAHHSVSAMYSAIKAALGPWAVGSDSGGAGDEDSPLVAILREQINSETQATGGDTPGGAPRTAQEYEGWLQSARRAPKLIGYRVRSVAELTNDPARKEAIRAAIAEIYGNAADDAAMYQELIHDYQSVMDRLNGTKSVSYFDCHYVNVLSYPGGGNRPTSCPDGEVVTGTQTAHWQFMEVTKLRCCKAFIST